jgi:hypothetical protein
VRAVRSRDTEKAGIEEAGDRALSSGPSYVQCSELATDSSLQSHMHDFVVSMMIFK